MSQVVLKDFRQTKIVELPSLPGSQIEIYDSLLLADMVGYDSDSKKFTETMINSLPKFIKSWNFVYPPTKNEAGEEVAGEPMPITRESLNFINAGDAQYLIEEIVAFNKQIKKNSQD